MKNRYLSHAAMGLFTTAFLVACQGFGAGVGYNPAASPNFSQTSPAQESPSTSTCKAKAKRGGDLLEYFATGDVKGTTFTAQAGGTWDLYDYKRVRPTPTPSPSPSPSPTPTPKTTKGYFYYGAFTLKNKQTGCAFLITTVSGKNFKGAAYNALTSGLANLKSGHYKVTLVESGDVASLMVSDLSAKGGTGSVNLVTSKHKPYTTGSIKLVGRRPIKISDLARTK